MFGKTELVCLHVEGMSCGHCTARVEQAVKELKGVKSAKADLADKSVTVTYVPEKVSSEEMMNAIEKAGYKVDQGG